MEQDVNISIEQFKQGLINTINQSNLPIGVIKYVFESVQTQLEAEYGQYIQRKVAEINQQQQAAAAAEAPEVVEGEVED